MAPISANDAYKKKYVKIDMIDGKTPYSAWATFIVHVLENDSFLKMIQKSVGYSQIKMTLKYDKRGADIWRVRVLLLTQKL